MVHLKIRLPDELFDQLQTAGTALDQNWEEIIQRALERYLDDFDDVSGSARRLHRRNGSEETGADRSRRRQPLRAPSDRCRVR